MKTQFERLAEDIVRHLRSGDPVKRAKGKAALMMAPFAVSRLVQKMLEEESV